MSTVTIELRDIAPWVAVLLSALALWYAVRKDSAKETTQKFKAIDTNIDAVDGKVAILAAEHALVRDRVVKVEGEIKHLPDKEVTHRLERSLLEMRGEMRGLTEQIKPIAAVSNRLQEAVFEKAGL